MAQLLLKTNEHVVKAELNDTVAAKDFMTRCPMTVSGFRSPVDYCCVAESGRFDPKEMQSGWKNGDISLAGGWFAVLFDGEEDSASYDNMMIIAHLDEENLQLVKTLARNVEFALEVVE